MGESSGMESVRELHAPEDHSGLLMCDGCDSEGWETEAPQWPCRTAELVYSADEIADITRTYRWWAAWGRERERRSRLASGWTESEDIGQWMNRAILSQLTRPSVLLDRLAQHDGGTVQKIGYLMPVSKEMLNDNR